MSTTAETDVTMMLKYSPDARRVRFGSSVSYGTIRTTDETVDDGNGVGIRKRIIVVTLPANGLPTLGEGDTVVVYATGFATSAQTSYIVRDKMLVEDGLIVKYRVVPS